jgi:peptidylprolyl isomerase
MNKTILYLFLIALSQVVYAKKKKLPEGIYAKFITTKGEMNFKIEYQKVPLPSCVFVGLAEGTLENKLTPISKPFYDNQKIYNINKDKFIVFGDPSNNSNENVGFYFHDQIDSSILNNAAGILGFANLGPNTNSSQIYLTKKPMPNLDYKYTVFGSMYTGFDVLYLLTKEDTIKKIVINRIGKNAQAFVCNKETYQKYQYEQYSKAEAIKQSILTNFTDSIIKYYPNVEILPSGLKINKQIIGNGLTPCETCKVDIKYTASFEDGTLFDKVDNPINTTLGTGKLARGLEEGIKNMTEGSKATIFIPYTLAYGDTGYKDRVPPRTNIIYEIELIKVTK